MHAVILAAGLGSRLHGAAGDNPKCLLRLGGMTLLERQIASLGGAGIDAITVVAGYQERRVAEVCGSRATVVLNDRYSSTNSLYSLWLTRSRLLGGAVVLNGDVLFHPRLLSDLLCARQDDALLVDYRPRSPRAFGTEEMKVTVRGGCVIDIGKTLRWEETDGENVGIAKFGPAGGAVLARCLDQLVQRVAITDWAPRAYLDLARLRPLHAVGTRGLPWVEIDFPEDYERAVEEVLPQLDVAPAVRATAAITANAAQQDAAPRAAWSAEVHRV